jgi:hypothetical protein
MQEFDRRKLEASIRRAGASEEVAKRVAERIKPSEGASTEELRKLVSQELRRENEAISGAYATTRRMEARSASDLAAGVVRVQEELLRKHGLQSGQHAHVMHMERDREVKLESAKSAKPDEIHMAKSDLEKLGVSEGSRVNVRFRP